MAKKEKTTEVLVELLHTPANGAKRTMWRGGRQFKIKTPQLLELTEEEVEVYENDARFKVSDPSDQSETETDGEASGSEADSSETGDSGEEANDDSEDQGSEDSDSDGEEADSGSDSESEEDSDDNDPEAQVKELLKNNDREELNAKATELGVENPDRKEWNKPEVAQAIVEAQAKQADGGATS